MPLPCAAGAAVKRVEKKSIEELGCEGKKREKVPVKIQGDVILLSFVKRGRH